MAKNQEVIRTRLTHIMRNVWWQDLDDNDGRKVFYWVTSRTREDADDGDLYWVRAFKLTRCKAQKSLIPEVVWLHPKTYFNCHYRRTKPNSYS